MWKYLEKGLHLHWSYSFLFINDVKWSREKLSYNDHTEFTGNFALDATSKGLRKKLSSNLVLAAFWHYLMGAKTIDDSIFMRQFLSAGDMTPGRDSG